MRSYRRLCPDSGSIRIWPRDNFYWISTSDLANEDYECVLFNLLILANSYRWSTCFWGKIAAFIFSACCVVPNNKPKRNFVFTEYYGCSSIRSWAIGSQLIPLFILLPAFTVLSAVTWTTFGAAIGRFMQSQQAFKIFNVIMASLLIICVIPIALG